MLLFLAVGFAANQEHIVVSWRNFDEQSALIFLGAWAQLILAVAVWFQIRSSESQRVDADRRHGDSVERAERVAQIEALVTFVGYASNASSLFQDAGRLLSRLLNELRAGTLTDVRPALERVAALQDLAEASRQAAATALFRVEALAGTNSAAHATASDFFAVISRQRTAAHDIRQWFESGHHQSHGAPFAPDATRVTRDSQPERSACIAIAQQIVHPAAGA